MEQLKLSLKDWKAKDIEVYNTIIAREWDFNVSGVNWWSDTIATFISEASDKGFSIALEDVEFCGFCNQGDGASFTGSVDIVEFLKSEKKLTKYRKIVNAIKRDDIHYSCDILRNDSRYSHKYTCFASELEYYEEKQDIESLCEEVLEMLELERLALCDELYNTLESAYDYLTSEEVIVDSLIANDYIFDEGGNIV